MRRPTFPGSDAKPRLGGSWKYVFESQNSSHLVLQEISRRELRKALERQGVTSLMEEEVLVLCDSLDPERRGRVRLSDVRDSLYRGTLVAGRGSEGEVCAADGVAGEMLPAWRGQRQDNLFCSRARVDGHSHTEHLLFSNTLPPLEASIIAWPFASLVPKTLFGTEETPSLGVRVSALPHWWPTLAQFLRHPHCHTKHTSY